MMTPIQLSLELSLMVLHQHCVKLVLMIPCQLSAQLSLGTLRHLSVQLSL